MDSSFCTSPPVEANHSRRVAAPAGKSSGIRRRAIEVIFVVYRYLIKPALFALSGPYQTCRHPVSCSEYAKQQFLIQPLHLAIRNSTKRVISCNPWTRYEIDPREELT